MKKEFVFEKMLEIFRENGIILLEGDMEQDLGIDSLRFISIIIQIEEEFNIIVPDEFLVQREYTDINSFVNMAYELIN